MTNKRIMDGLRIEQENEKQAAAAAAAIRNEQCNAFSLYVKTNDFSDNQRPFP